MKKIFYILILESCVFFSGLVSANEFKAQCMKYKEKPNINIALEFDALTYNHTKVPRALARLQLEKQPQTVMDGYQVMGLTTYDFGTELNFKIEEKIVGDRLVCYYPTDINLVISMRYPTIYIVRTVPKNSCQYDRLLRHEHMHLQLATEAFKSYKNILKEKFLEAIIKYPVAGRPQKDVSIETVRDNLTEKYLSVLTPLVQELQNEINKEQAKLDSPENYDYEQNLCSN